MALKSFPVPFPIFSPTLNPNSNPNLLPQPHHRPPSEINFSRWNNANAREFNERRRAQKEIEEDIRRTRRFNSATNIIDTYDSSTANLTNDNFKIKSIGTPSSPSAPSIPGRKSKYSQPENPNYHPAFQRISRITKSRQQKKCPKKPIDRNADVKLSEDGLSFVVDGAPFEFKYSYTETPKVKPIKLREPPFSPFGPTTMGRPWTGRAPLPPSKKKLREFDSFRLPPPDKKGVKPVQKPGPFLPGSSPRYVYTREEILGEPLTEEEVKDLIEGCLKTRRQLNMGRDGLTHNMLDNIHAHWKRRRVCKIKCLGVCTVDMDNVCNQLEERTGGKVIYRKGGVLYLFRGRNYNYKTRPRFPLMLWKPVTPVYPRLIKHAPEGLTLEEATVMRKKGRKLLPICKLAKNGVYCNLVKEVREAFEECELVKIDCRGVTGSDYRKVGAKLKELVPCVLISFQYEHILMWRGRNWKSSLTKPINDCEEAKGSDVNSATSIALLVEDQRVEMVSQEFILSEPNMSSTPVGSDEHSEDQSAIRIDGTPVAMGISSTAIEMCESNTTKDNGGSLDVCGSEVTSNAVGNEAVLSNLDYTDEMPVALSMTSETMLESVGSKEELHDALEGSHEISKPANFSDIYADGVLQLRKQAVESGSAVILSDADLDADTVYQRAVAFAKSAPPGPVFIHRRRKLSIQKSEKKENKHLEANEILDLEDLEKSLSQATESEKRNSKPQRKKKCSLDSAPRGCMGVDELAKLLA